MKNTLYLWLSILKYYIMKNLLLTIAFVLLTIPGVQVYSQSFDEYSWDNILERLLSDEELSAEACSELTEYYCSLKEQPLNINTATTAELSQLLFLTERQIEEIEAYIYIHGAMKSLGELQLIGSLDFDTRQILRHFVLAGDKPAEIERIKWRDVLKYGRNELTVKSDIPLYMRDGFKYHSPEELERYPNRSYLGGRLSHSVRYSFNWHQRIKAGITADKDSGEPLFHRNKTGYDFYSPFFYYSGDGTLRELAIGKFKARFGRGLLFSSAFSTGKSAILNQNGRILEGLQPHSSTSETGYFRGVGMTLGKGHTSMTILAASTPVDATLRGDSVIRSIKTDGMHRTELEWSKKHNVTQQTGGINVRYYYNAFSVGITAVAERFSLPWDGREQSFGISGNWLLNRSLFSTSGEVSFVNGSPALLGSLKLRFLRYYALDLTLRYYSPDYYAHHASSLAESNVSNEAGLLLALTRNTSHLKTCGYLDLFMHPEPRYGASDRSYGIDTRLETDWEAGRSDALYFTARVKSKQKDCKPTGRLEYCITCRFRLRWIHSFRSGAESRTQIYYTRYDFIAEPITHGWALTQSYSKTFFKDKLSLNIQGAAFLTDSYDCNVSVYESGLRYSYNFLTLYGHGLRLGLTVKYKPKTNIQFNLKAGSTCYTDRDEISSSQQRIESNHKEDISIQLITKF